MNTALFVEVFLRFFFLLTPFFVLSTFLSMTQGYGVAQRRHLAIRVTLAVVGVCAVLYFFGQPIFRVFGISLDAFRVGAGILLFLTAVSLVRDKPKEAAHTEDEDIAVVPLAIPVTVGPATTGALMLMGIESFKDVGDQITTGVALLCSIACIGVILYLAPLVDRIFKRRGIAVLSKLTGLILSAMAAEMVFGGARGLLNQ